MKNPRIEINLLDIEKNVKIIVDKGKENDINIVGVTKAVLADEKVIRAFLRGGITNLGDSRLENRNSTFENAHSSPHSSDIPSPTT